VVDTCLERIDKIIDECSVDGSANISHNDHIEQVRSNYTMQAEREVHDSFAGVASAAEDEAPVPGGSEYGDNVELF